MKNKLGLIALACGLALFATTARAVRADDKEWRYATLVIDSSTATINKGGQIVSRLLRSANPAEASNPEYQLRERAKQNGYPDDGRKRDERGTVIDILNRDFGESGWELIAITQDGARQVYTFKRAERS